MQPSTSSLRRSGRVDLDTISGESSSNTSRLLEPISSWGGSHSQSEDLDSLAGHFTFLDVLQASGRFKVPSTYLHGLGLASDNSSTKQIFSLGSGLTSEVIRHEINQQNDQGGSPGSIIALKIFKPHSRENDSAAENRHEVYRAILREVQTLRQPLLHGHPNILQLLFIGWHKEHRFPIIAMELGDYGPLDFIMREANPAPTSAHKRHITLDIALGLEAIHSAGFIHGDLKPENLLIMAHDDPSRQIVAKLSDFGGSSQLYGGKFNRPAHFTPLWSAPEVVNQDHDIDWEKADIYSYGLVIASLWSRRDNKLADERPRQRSSCYLSWIIPWMADETIPEDIIWNAKSSRHMCISIFKNMLEEISKDKDIGIEVPELLDIISPTLERYFWQRPSTKGLVQSLFSFGKKLGRTVEIAEIIPDEPIQGDQKAQAQSDPDLEYESSWVKDRDFQEVILEQSLLALDDLKSALDVKSLSESVDLPAHIPESFSHDEFLQSIRKSLKCSVSPVTENKKLALLSWRLALSHFLGLGTRPDSKVALEWMRFSALHGRLDAMHIVALMVRETVNESKVPIRLYLSLLALSGSKLALQHLSIYAPEYFRMAKEVIQKRGFAYTTQREQNKSVFHIVDFYRDLSPSIPSITTLGQALEVGDLSRIKQILDGSIITPDSDDILPSLLHEISHLIDIDASSIARAAFDRGARLDVKLSCESPIFGLDPWMHTFNSLPATYSPLSAAIIRGKSKLALTIIRLHIEFNIPIPDFPAASSLGFRYLHYDVGEMILNLFQANPLMCHDEGHPWNATETFFTDLLSLAIYRPDVIELERCAIRGGEFDAKYKKCLEILLEKGADPLQGVGHECPLDNAIMRDDLIAFRSFINQLQLRGIPIEKLAKTAGNVWLKGPTANTVTALRVCLSFNSIDCFEFLINNFPDLVAEDHDKSGESLLRHACFDTSNAKFVSLLLDSRVISTAVHRPSGIIALEKALARVYLSAADLLASRRSGELATLLSRYDKGQSVFFDLIEYWLGHRPVRFIDSLQWLVDHKGVHFHGPNDIPILEYLFHKPRPTRRSDQLRDAEILDFLLGLNIFLDRLNEYWKGRTLLHTVAMNGHVEAVNLLLERKVDVNAKTTKVCIDMYLAGWTALDLSYMALHADRIPSEIKAGGKVEMQKWGDDIRSIIRLLRANISSNFEMGPIQEAVETEASEIREYILRTGAAFPPRSRIYHHGDWPRLLSLDGTNDSPQQSPGDNLETGFLMDTIAQELVEIQEKAFLNNELGWYREASGGFGAPSYNEYNKQKAQRRRDKWRIPPGWLVLRLEGTDMVLFINFNMGTITQKKPELYRGEDDVTYAYDQKVNDKANAVKRPRYAEIALKLHTTGEAGRYEHTKAFNNILRHSTSNTVSGFFPLGSSIDQGKETVNLLYIIVDAELQCATAVISGSPEEAKALIDGDFDYRNPEGLTQLQEGVIHENYDLVSIFAAHGAQVDNPFPVTGLSPLHVSIEKGSRNMTDLLLDAGANPNSKTQEGVSPLHFCLVTRDQPDILELLIRHGADINEILQDTTPLQLAIALDLRQSIDILRTSEANRGDKGSKPPGGGKGGKPLIPTEEVEPSSSEEGLIRSARV
ncbi:hypothetical protein F5Y11DRAFT_332441 [Daldinia sp. FL1419]|nr:hypothetical protein F5Y11DRAFT_332441 [Daldinia sp. FL1419]